MIHVELRALYPTRAIEPTACPGELEAVLDAVDPVDGHQVRVYVCRLCRGTVVVDETDRRVRNDYREPAPFDGWGFMGDGR